MGLIAAMVAGQLHSVSAANHGELWFRSWIEDHEILLIPFPVEVSHYHSQGQFAFQNMEERCVATTDLVFRDTLQKKRQRHLHRRLHEKIPHPFLGL
jgi:hypothetical protein